MQLKGRLLCKVFYTVLLAFLTLSCSDTFIVLSSDFAYSMKTEKVYQMHIDTSLYVYDKFKGEPPKTNVKKRRPLNVIYILKQDTITPSDLVEKIEIKHTSIQKDR